MIMVFKKVNINSGQDNYFVFNRFAFVTKIRRENTILNF